MIKVHPDQYSRNRQKQSRSIWISPPSSSKAVQSEFIINSSDRLISNKREKFAWIVRLESFVSSLAVSFKYLDSLKKIHATTFFIPQITQGETEKVSNTKSAFSSPFPNWLDSLHCDILLTPWHSRCLGVQENQSLVKHFDSKSHWGCQQYFKV